MDPPSWKNWKDDRPSGKKGIRDGDKKDLESGPE